MGWWMWWACAQEPQTCVPAPLAEGTAAADPLPTSVRWGAWETYERLPDDVDAAVEGARDQARAAGLEVARIHVGWDELEPGPGRFQLDGLTTQLDAAAGLAVQLLIETVDSEGFSLPRDLVTGDGALVDGLSFDDPLVTDRFACLLDQVLPALDDHPVFAISVGNEPDTRLDDVDPRSDEGLTWIDTLVGFLEPARDRVRAARPEIGVSMTLRQGSLEAGIDTLGPLISAGTVATFNYYCQGPDFFVQPATVVPGELDAIEAAAGGLPIVLQELGCPAGAANSTIGASETLQEQFYATVAEELAARPAFQAAFVFQLVDWSPELSATFADAFADAGFPELGAQVEESLSTLGLIRYDDGTPRPAFDVFLDALSTDPGSIRP
jgi:hypothetical protein